MSRKLRIVIHRYFDETARQQTAHWTVEEWRKLWIFSKRWRPLKHVVCSGAGGCYNVVTEFSSFAKAENAVEALKTGAPIDEWTREVME